MDNTQAAKVVKQKHFKVGKEFDMADVNSK
jgi:hypothetical protein